MIDMTHTAHLHQLRAPMAAVLCSLSVWAVHAADAPPGPPQAPEGWVDVSEVGRATVCAIARMPSCDVGLAVERGLFETGLKPAFPGHADCRGIDDGFAMNYSGKRDHEAFHGGIDLPAPRSTPMLAAANGTVVGVFSGERSHRGIEVVLRHSPDDTGLPMWTYTQYAHCAELPAFQTGQRLHMGDTICPTGNTGIQTGGGGGKRQRERRTAIHFAVFYSASPHYTLAREVVVPADGHWMDPLAFYRPQPPYDSAAMKALPDPEKAIDIPVWLPGGQTHPAQTQRIWPYACAKK